MLVSAVGCSHLTPEKPTSKELAPQKESRSINKGSETAPTLVPSDFCAIYCKGPTVWDGGKNGWETSYDLADSLGVPLGEIHFRVKGDEKPSVVFNFHRTVPAAVAGEVVQWTISRFAGADEGRRISGLVQENWGKKYENDESTSSTLKRRARLTMTDGSIIISQS